MLEKTPTILIADDDRVIRLKLRRFLEKEMGLDVVIANDGDEAWELFTNSNIQFVVSDWLMPGCDGPELCRKIRELDNRPYTYFILLTGKTEKTDILKGMAHGADDYVCKPFDPAELQSRVNAGLRVINLERKLAAKNEELMTALAAASQVQESMLPKMELLRTMRNQTGVEVAYKYVSCEGLGGDVLGLAQPSGDEIALFLADVSGHGIAASLSAVSLHTYIQACMITSIEPVDIVSRANQYCNEEFAEHTYASLVYIKLDLKKRQGSMLVAGHPPVIVMDSTNNMHTYEATIPPLGLFPDNPTEADLHHIELLPTTRLVTYTDGVIESRNPDGQFFSFEQLGMVIARCSDSPIDDVPQLVLDGLHQWTQNDEREEDDITIVGLQVN